MSESRVPQSSEHVARPQRDRVTSAPPSLVELAAKLIPPDRDQVELALAGGPLRLTHLREVLWPGLGLTKGDLLRYYASVAPVLVPHLRDRAMEMRRYPSGAAGEFFFVKRSPEGRPPFVRFCSIAQGPGDIVEYPVIQDLPSLLWIVNLGSIDLSPCPSRYDDTERPDFLHLDLAPTPGATFAHALEAALLLRGALEELGVPSYAKTSGSRGVQLQVPIVRGPDQRVVWTYAKALASLLSLRAPSLLTAEHRAAKRPRQRVVIDYNQNTWGRTPVSPYSVCPTAAATVSTPVSWGEVERGFPVDEHRMKTVPERVERLGDLWAPLLDPARRVDLGELV
jgi:bifunctional non-homologous end joining protein LigD